MTLGFAFAKACGSGRNDCHWLAYRYEAETGFTPDRCDSWIGQGMPEGHYVLISQKGWITDICRTENRVWAAHVCGYIYMNPSLILRKEPWNTYKLNASLSGIWGMNDNTVFAWGLRGSENVLFLYREGHWSDIDSPGKITCMHCNHDGLILAGGYRGLIARWDGDEFRPLNSTITSPIADIFIESENQVYACCQDGYLLTGTIDKLCPLLKHEASLHCIAKWNGEIWVGAGSGGLYRLESSGLCLHNRKVLAENMDVRDTFLISAPNAIIESTDGISFNGSLIKTFVDLSKHEAPGWKCIL